MQTNRWGRLAAFVCVLVLPAVCGLFSPKPAAAIAASAADFCHAPSANPYLTPLNRLPAIHEPPSNGRLPFAPSVYMKPISGPLVVHGESIGFTLPVRPPRSARRQEKPQWRVLATVSVLASDGEVRRVVKRIVDLVRFAQTTKLIFVTPARSAIYRVNVIFETRDGSRVARYGQYFRAAPPKFGARIALSGSQFAPGAVISARLENTGTRRFSAGYGYRVERFTGTSWEIDASLQDERVVPRVLVGLRPTVTFDCLHLPIPSGQMPGRYRFVKEVGRTGDAPKRDVVVTQTFTVAGSDS